MENPLALPSRKLLAAALGLMTLPVCLAAQDLTPPKVANPLHNLTVSAGTTQSVVGLKNTFALKDVTGKSIVRMATVLGNIDIEMFSAAAPKNVANFLAYVNSGEYNKTFIHRSVPNFVIQGGGYYLNSSGDSELITQMAAVEGEHSIPNTRGTLALALSTGPNSGTSQWFFNLADNTQLDTGDGGPFTVFGRVIEADMNTVDAIAALPIMDLGGEGPSGPFADVPLYDYSAATGFTDANLVFLNKVAVIPLVPTAAGAASVLKLKVTNSHPALVMATIDGPKLKLRYRPDQTGSAVIEVIARDAAGSIAKSRFTVTVK